MLGDCRAAFHPVAAVDVDDAKVLVQGSAMDMAAHDAVDVVLAGGVGDRLLVVAD